MRKTLKNEMLRSFFLYVILICLSFFVEVEIIPSRFPFHAMTTFFYLILLTVLLYYFCERIADRGVLRRNMLRCVSLMILFLLLRTAKYEAFPKLSTISRYVWYLYYAPLLLLPLYMLLAVLGMEEGKEKKRSLAKPVFVFVTFAMLFFVLSNDLHQLIFRFQPGFQNWDGDYSYGFGYYVVVFWNYFLYGACIFFMMKKCRLSTARRLWWMTLLPLFCGIAVLLVIATGHMPAFNGNKMMEFPEATCFMVAIFWETCIRIGLIPTNKGYGELLRNSSLAMQIMDADGEGIYYSDAACKVTARQWEALRGSEGKPCSLDESTVAYLEKIPGGYCIWQSDVSEINRFNRELEEISAKLSEETELMRLENELREKQEAILQRTKLYDGITAKTRTQSDRITALASEALESEDALLKKKNAGRICFLGAYIKRYANLTLLAQRDGAVDGAELGMAIAESLRTLGNSGIPVDYVGGGRRQLSAQAALSAYETFEVLTEQHLNELSAVYVTLTNDAEEMLLKITIEGAELQMEKDLEERLEMAGIRRAIALEDGVSYVRLWMKKEESKGGAYAQF